MNLTQSAVSMQIKRLEEMLDLTLLERANRRVSLTAPGEQLVGYARRMLDLNDEVVGRLTEETFEGELALGVPHDIVYPCIPRVLNPRVKVNLRSSSTMRLREAMARGEVDVILTTEEGVGEGGETLTQMNLRWTGAQGGVSWKRRPLRLAFCRQCIFRPIVLRKLDAAGVDWELAGDSEDDRAVYSSVTTTLPVDLRDRSKSSASAACSSGSRCETCGRRRPAAYQSKRVAMLSVRTSGRNLR